MKNLIKHIIYFALIFVLISCGEEGAAVPSGIIAEDKMIAVITEIELTQALIKLKFSNRDSTINQQELFNEVYTDFEITEEQFNNSLSFYCKEPKLLEGMYIKVINSLSEKQVENQ